MQYPSVRWGIREENTFETDAFFCFKCNILEKTSKIKIVYFSWTIKSDTEKNSSTKGQCPKESQRKLLFAKELNI
jgi:hypothetical protein